MKPAPLAFALLSLTALLAGCGEPVSDNHFANSAVGAQEGPADAVRTEALPVRIGEYGVNFDACPWAGTTRRIEPGATLPVRAAPFETGAEAGTVAAGARFFVCARSLDQKWFGIVHDESGALAPRCGVSDPIAATRAYDGPCRSGWVSSAFVKLIAGNDGPASENQPSEPLPEPAQAR